jgi:hypothetical protein
MVKLVEPDTPKTFSASSLAAGATPSETSPAAMPAEIEATCVP